MSGEQLDQIAPLAAAASSAITLSGMFGMNDTTRSPASMPSASSVVVSAPTLEARSAQAISRRGCVSDWKMIAGRVAASGREAPASACSA